MSLAFLSDLSALQLVLGSDFVSGKIGLLEEIWFPQVGFGSGLVVVGRLVVEDVREVLVFHPLEGVTGIVERIVCRLRFVIVMLLVSDINL